MFNQRLRSEVKAHGRMVLESCRHCGRHVKDGDGAGLRHVEISSSCRPVSLAVVDVCDFPFVLVCQALRRPILLSQILQGKEGVIR